MPLFYTLLLGLILPCTLFLHDASAGNDWFVAVDGEQNRQLAGAGKIRFKHSALLVSGERLLNLNEQRIVTIRFPETKGIFSIDLFFRIKAAGKPITVNRKFAVSPSAGPKEIVIDFSGVSQFAGIVKEVAIKLYGIDAHLAPPSIKMEKGSVASRLSAFFKEWFRPLEIRAITVNFHDWPLFFGIPSPLALIFFWLAGSVLTAVLCKVRMFPFPRALVLWSLSLWILVDVSLLIVKFSSLPRFKAMENSYSDAIGSLPREARELSGKLKTEGISSVKFAGGNIDSYYLRFALLPVRLTTSGENAEALIIPNKEKGKVHLDNDYKILLNTGTYILAEKKS